MPAAPPGCAEGIGPRQASVFVVGMGVTGSRCTLRPCGQAERSCAEHAREEESGRASAWPPAGPAAPNTHCAPRHAPPHSGCALRAGRATPPRGARAGGEILTGWALCEPVRCEACLGIDLAVQTTTTTSARPTPAGLPRASAHPPSHASGQPPEVGTMWVLLYT